MRAKANTWVRCIYSERFGLLHKMKKKRKIAVGIMTGRIRKPKLIVIKGGKPSEDE